MVRHRINIRQRGEMKTEKDCKYGHDRYFHADEKMHNMKTSHCTAWECECKKFKQKK